jgi:hypothetical protein
LSRAVPTRRSGTPPGGPAGRARKGAGGAATHARELAADEAAWLAVLPCAAVVLLAIVVLGPPLGRALFPAQPFAFWPTWAPSFAPEPTEQARYLLALTAPLLLSGATYALVRRSPSLSARTTATLVIATQVAGLAFLIACFAVQRTYVFPLAYRVAETAIHTVYFRVPTLLVAAAIAVATFTAARSPTARARVARWAAESRWRLLISVLVAVALVAISVLPAIVNDASASSLNPTVQYHVGFTADETFAVLDGLSPLGNFAAQYGSLWPYAIAAAMALFGHSLAAWSVAAAVIDAVALLGLFGVLRRVTGRSLTALLLFAPLVATCLFTMRGPPENRYSIANLYGSLPLRLAGPLLLVWLTARHLDGARPRRAWPLFLLGGLVALNNSDFGLAALGATLAAVLWTGGRPTATSVRRLAAQLALGLVVAFALVTTLLLLRTGSPPHFALLLRYARLFGLGGFALLPMRPLIGVSTVIYLTYIAAIGTATVRALRAEPDRLLTGLLAWSGIFGLGVGVYYMGRSHPEVLTNMFPPWALTVTLLTIVVVRRLAAHRLARPPLAELACLFAFGILVCSLAQTPTPWSQAKRLQATGPHVLAMPPGYAFVAASTHRGEHVALVTMLGHRIAYELGLDDVTPYTGPSILTEQQLAETVKALHDAGGHKVFVSRRELPQEVGLALQSDGFALAKRDSEGTELWVHG